MKLSKNLTPVAATLLLALGGVSTANAGAKLAISDDAFISVGAGIRTTFTATEDGSPNGDSYSTDFDLSSSRIYISGQLNSEVKFTFNTEEIWGEYGVLDAIVQYEPSEKFNIWAGRMLTPADRIEMNGPFYALSWNQYTVPLFPSDWSTSHSVAGAYGRDEGVTVWGTLGKFQYAVGVFDGFNGPSNEDDDLLYAGRFSYSFWGMEGNPAYYTSSTYYGKAGDILTLGVSAQSQTNGAGAWGQDDGGLDVVASEDFSAIAVDLLMEKVFDGGGVMTIEGEFKTFDCDCSFEEVVIPSGSFTLFDGDAYFATAAYMFAGKMGMGHVQPYVRYTSNEPEVGEESDLTEFGINYIIDGHNLRLNANVTDGDANASGYLGEDTTTFTFGIQFQI